MTEFFIGMVCGIALSLIFGFGPAFFTQIQASIHYGYRTSKVIPLGILIGDFAMMMVGLLATSSLNSETMTQVFQHEWVICMGALVIALYGAYLIWGKPKHTSEQNANENISLHNVQQPRRQRLLLRGFLIVFVNPGNWVYWITLVTFVRFGSKPMDFGETGLFFGGVLLTNYLVDNLKCKLSSLLRQILTYRFLKIFNVVTGAVLIGIAIFMAVAGFTKRDNTEATATRQQEVIEQVSGQIEQVSGHYKGIKLPIITLDSLRQRVPRSDSNRHRQHNHRRSTNKVQQNNQGNKK